ncbi:hypothetical protein FRC07_005331 [Ceratobasidium sp. 392]|nr:hypothetical protein FRC07_005331 [Ceratobasidium sp. 392]
MDDESFGFDTSFSTRMGDDQRLDYYVDLPGDVLGDGHLTDPRSSTLKFKVVERLCHRKDIVGRATIVLRIRQVKPLPVSERTRTRSQKRKFEASQPEELYDTSYVLKLMWRDPYQEPEGPILSELVGAYGVVQYLWHSDSYWTCKCMRVRGSRCGMCLDETPQVENMMTVQNLRDIENAVRVTDDGQVKCVEINTKRLTPTTETRRRRIYSRILLSSVGRPLWEAESPRELLTGMLDAIMGCWRLVNMGILHRDISGGNVMLLPLGQEMCQREWLEGPKKGEEISESEARLREYLAVFDRDPTGMLSDFDLHMRLPEDSSSTAFCKPESDNGSLFGPTRVRSPLNPEPEDRRNESNLPHAKRRRTDDSYAPVSGSYHLPPRPARVWLWDEPARGGLGYQSTSEKRDYRVGTTTFMSTKVLNVKPGNRYKHGFIDDLESFFWVLFYTVVGRRNSITSHPDPAAMEILNKLDSESMAVVRWHKLEYLEDCHRNPELMIGELRKIENSWASDDTLIQLLVRLGSFFYDEGEVRLTEMEPEYAFPTVVDLFIKALEHL